MTGWVGTFALAAALCSSVACLAAWALAARRPEAARAARWLALVPLLAAATAVGAVEHALVSHDFAVRFVAENGSRETPAYYTVTSLWAAHDGSLLLWLLLLTAYVAVLAWLRPPGEGALHSWSVTALAAVAAFFAGLALFSTHLFDAVSPVPSDGPGPNPLLADHPAMGVHPPLLYTGLLGTAVLFAYAVGALVTGRADAAWARAVRPWALWTWSTLTAGIVLGAWWSYAVLGWGGYWAWDPVENAALLPWLLTTALLHAGMVQRRPRGLAAWNLGLSVAAFVLAGLGVFLTRSGVTGSVHAFAASGVGIPLLAFLAAVIAGVGALALLRRGGLPAPPWRPGPVLSRAAAILTNNLLLAVFAATVLLGTLYPVFAAASSGAQVSVGPSYFDAMGTPLVVALLALMGVGPYLGWRGDAPRTVLRRAVPPVVAGAVVTALVALRAPSNRAGLVVFGLAAFVAASIVTDGVRRLGRMRAGSVGRRRLLRRMLGLGAHLGFAVMMCGVVASSAYAVSGEGTVSPGHAHRVAGVEVAVSGVSRHRSGGDIVTSAALVLHRGARTSRLAPGLRYAPAQDTTVAVPAISSRVSGDLYVTLLSAARNGTVTVRVARNPMIGLVWGGGGLMALCGLASLAMAGPGRRRVRRRPRRRVVEPEALPSPRRAPELVARSES